MFKDRGHHRIVNHDGEILVSRGMKCCQITKGTKIVVKELRRIWNNKNTNRKNYDKIQGTNLNNLKDKKEEPIKYDPNREHDKYEIGKSTTRIWTA